MYICVCMYVYVIHISISLYIHIHLHTHTYIHISLSLSISLSLYIYIYTHLSLSLYIYIYIYIFWRACKEASPTREGHSKLEKHNPHQRALRPRLQMPRLQATGIGVLSRRLCNRRQAPSTQQYHDSYAYTMCILYVRMCAYSHTSQAMPHSSNRHGSPCHSRPSPPLARLPTTGAGEQCLCNKTCMYVCVYIYIYIHTQ